MESADQCAAIDDGGGAGGLGDGDAVSGGGGDDPAAVDVVSSDGKCAPDGGSGGGTAGTVGGEPVVGTGRDAGVADSLPRRRFPWDEAPVYGKSQIRDFLLGFEVDSISVKLEVLSSLVVRLVVIIWYLCQLSNVWLSQFRRLQTDY
jgi:hypothetical protein